MTKITKTTTTKKQLAEKAHKKGQKTFMAECRHHGRTKHYASTGKCVQCEVKRVAKHYERADSDPAYRGAHREKNAATQWRKVTGGRMHEGYETERETLRKIYTDCPEGWQVDHSIPKGGDTCVGLHTTANLGYADKRTNMRKGTQFDPARIRSQRPLNDHKDGAYDPRLSERDYEMAVMLAALFADTEDDLGVLKNDPCPINRLVYRLLTKDTTTMYRPLGVAPYRDALATVEAELAHWRGELAKLAANEGTMKEAA